MDLKNIFENRRSVNFFDKEKKIEDNVLKDIINLAVTAPSAFNLQPWEIIAIKSEEGKERLYPLTGNQIKIKEAPITLIIVGDLEGYSKNNPIWQDFGKLINDEKALGNYQNYAEKLYGSTSERKYKFAESNAGLLAMSIMYSAKYYGVDSHVVMTEQIVIGVNSGFCEKVTTPIRYRGELNIINRITLEYKALEES